MKLHGRKTLTRFWPMFSFYTPENTRKPLVWFSDVFRGYKMKTLAGNGLIKLENKQTEAL